MSIEIIENGNTITDQFIFGDILNPILEKTPYQKRFLEITNKFGGVIEQGFMTIPEARKTASEKGNNLDFLEIQSKRQLD